MPFGPVKTPDDAVKAAKRGAESGAVAMAAPGLPPLPPPSGNQKVFFYSSTVPAKADGPVVKLDADSNSQVSKTDLGVQTIEGVKAQGTRVTRTIPAGKIGNVQPIVITSETWYSPELKVLLMSKVNDPRMGETTYQLTGLARAEPSPSLFEVPADYTVKEGKTNFVFRTAPNSQK